MTTPKFQVTHPMLQIVTKKFFRENVPLHSTLHREVLYTNCTFLRADRIELPVATLAPSTALTPVSTVTVDVMEHLEAEYPDGTRSGHVATGGRELIDDLAVVLSFGLNATFSRNGDLVRRLVPDDIGTERETRASRLFGRTFEANRYVPELEIDRLKVFTTQLLALPRKDYERAIRAMRRIVGATQRAADDPTLAYVDIVAALEALSAGANVPMATWEQMDDRKRRLFDEALDDADPKTVERVRQAALEAEHAGMAARFRAFIRSTTTPAFFRDEAIGVSNPVRGADLERVVRRAYQIRSSNVHDLEELQPEVWMLGSRFETITPRDNKLTLSHAGVTRLARHVVTNFVARGSTEPDEAFDWRSQLPGMMRMPFAPEYWVWQADGFNHASIERYFSGFVQNLLDTAGGRTQGIADMQKVLARIETLVPGTSGIKMTQMVAMYVLWHRIMTDNFHRPGAAAFIANHELSLKPPGLASFVTSLLIGEIPEWTPDEWHELAAERRAQRAKEQQLKLPAGVDAALHICAADFLAKTGRLDEARQHAAFAIEELPGNERLLTWESTLGEAEVEEINIWELAVQPKPPAEDQAAAQEQPSAHEPEADPDPPDDAS